MKYWGVYSSVQCVPGRPVVERLSTEKLLVSLRSVCTAHQTASDRHLASNGGKDDNHKATSTVDITGKTSDGTDQDNIKDYPMVMILRKASNGTQGFRVPNTEEPCSVIITGLQESQPFKPDPSNEVQGDTCPDPGKSAIPNIEEQRLEAK